MAAGRAYLPASDSWLLTPRLPLEPEEIISGAHVAWTGNSSIIFGGRWWSWPLDADCDPDPLQPDTLAGWQ